MVMEGLGQKYWNIGVTDGWEICSSEQLNLQKGSVD